MAIRKPNKFYDIVYQTNSGRLMVAKKIEAKTKTDARAKLKMQMRASTSFKKIIMITEV